MSLKISSIGVFFALSAVLFAVVESGAHMIKSDGTKPCGNRCGPSSGEHPSDYCTLGDHAEFFAPHPHSYTPRSLNVVPSLTSIDVTWEKPKYKLRWCPLSGYKVRVDTDLVDVGTRTSHTITGLEEGTEYKVSVQAIFTCGSNVGCGPYHSNFNSATSTIETLSAPTPPTPGVTVAPTELTIDEDGEGTYTVVLDSEPDENVTITPTSGDASVATVSSETLTFTRDTWDREQTITVAAPRDNDATNSSTRITHAVSGYGDVTTADDVQIKVTDVIAPPPPVNNNPPPQPPPVNNNPPPQPPPEPEPEPEPELEPEPEQSEESEQTEESEQQSEESEEEQAEESEQEEEQQESEESEEAEEEKQVEEFEVEQEEEQPQIGQPPPPEQQEPPEQNQPEQPQPEPEQPQPQLPPQAEPEQPTYNPGPEYIPPPPRKRPPPKKPDPIIVDSIQWDCGADSTWSVFSGSFTFHIDGEKIEVSERPDVIRRYIENDANIIYTDGRCALHAESVSPDSVVRVFKGYVRRDRFHQYTFEDDMGDMYLINRRYSDGSGGYTPPFEQVWYRDFADFHNRDEPRPQVGLTWVRGQRSQAYYLPVNFSRAALDTLRQMPQDDRPFLENVVVSEEALPAGKRTATKAASVQSTSWGQVKSLYQVP